MNKIALALIDFYKYFISPLLPRSCRFYPTCSSYAVACYKEHSFVKASALTVRRLCACHPFNEGGIDLPPVNK